MEVILVPSSSSPEQNARLQFLSTYLINGTVAIDAGCLGFWRTPAEQARVKHLFLTHTHLDHLASLPMFLGNVYSGDGDCVTIYGSEAVLDCLRRDLFNDRLWPDFVRISTQIAPFLKLRPLRAGEAVTADGLELTPVEVNHTVPTFGYIVSDGRSAVAIPSDTGPTEEIWERASRIDGLKAVFLESAMSNDQAELAAVARHLTPELFLHETRKLRRAVRWVVVHLYPSQREQIVRELESLGVANLEVGRFGVPYVI